MKKSEICVFTTMMIAIGFSRLCVDDHTALFATPEKKGFTKMSSLHICLQPKRRHWLDPGHLLQIAQVGQAFVRGGSIALHVLTCLHRHRRVSQDVECCATC